MLKRLPKERYHFLTGLKELKIFPLIHAVLLQRQDGEIYLDEGGMLANIFVIHKSGFAQLKLADAYSNFDAIADFIKTNSALPDYFHIYAAPEKLVMYFEKEQTEVGIKIRQRVKLQYRRSDLDTPARLPANFSCHAINKENFDLLSSFNLALDSKYWDSKDHFLKDGYGYYIEAPGKIPAAICYAACVVDNVSEIDIFTDDKYRKMGLAKIATAYYVQESIRRGVTANWDCFTENVASLTVAKNMGFEQINDYTFLSLYFKK